MATTDRLAQRLLRPKIVLPTVVVVLVLGYFLGTPPQDSALDRTGPLTTSSTKAAGARGLYDLASRLGWPVEQKKTPFDQPLDTAAVYLILDPPVSLSGTETHVVLDAVRRGAGLLYVAESEGGLDDSLHMRPGGGAYMIQTDSAIRRRMCKPDPGQPAIMWIDGAVHLYQLKDARAWPTDTTTFVSLRRSASDTSDGGRVVPAAVGYPFGRGRIVALSDADLLRNDVIRVCRWNLGVTAVSMLQYASGGDSARPRLVFDEYHFGGALTRMDMDAAVWQFLTRTAPGNVTLGVIAAGLVLLLASAWRPVVPKAKARIERRSALEHVEALARAYARVGATRSVARRLVRGLRRRHAPSVRVGGSATSDEMYLRWVAARHREVAQDAETVIGAEERRITPAELLTVGQAVDHIDRILSS